MKTIYRALPIAIVIILSIAIILLFIANNEKPDRITYFEEAKVLRVVNERLNKDTIVPSIYLGTQELEVKIISGKHKGEIHTVNNSLSRLYNVHAKEGMDIIVNLEMNGDKISNVYVHNYKREGIIYFIVGLFVALLIVIGGVNGFKAAISLFFTGVMIIFYMLPKILKGANPISITIITVSVITIVSFYLISGWSRKSLAAILGTVCGVIIAGIISYIAGRAAHLSGLTMEEAEQLLYIAADTYINIRGLMFAAILIASMGAVNDVAMSIASSIFEINKVNTKLTGRELFKSGMTVGKDIMGTMANTLILAFVGSSLNIILLIMALKMPYNQLINLDLIGSEVVQGIAGTIGIIMTVPITAIISVLLTKKNIMLINKK